MASFKVLPVFTLFRIRPADVHRKYLSGHFATAKLSPPAQKVNQVKESFKEIITDDFTKSIFSVTSNKSTTSDIFASTNCKGYEVMHESGKVPEGGRCWYCRNDFKHQSIGIPIHMDSFYTDLSELILGFHTDGIFHDFRCALKYLRTWPRYREMYPEAETYLFNMFHLMHPKAGPLVEANDFRLLDINGGPLPWDKWSDVTYQYVETPRLIMLSLKRVFQQRRTAGAI